jgi:hypothetical protein
MSVLAYVVGTLIFLGVAYININSEKNVTSASGDSPEGPFDSRVRSWTKSDGLKMTLDIDYEHPQY